MGFEIFMTFERHLECLKRNRRMTNILNKSKRLVVLCLLTGAVSTFLAGQANAQTYGGYSGAYPTNNYGYNNSMNYGYNNYQNSYGNYDYSYPQYNYQQNYRDHSYDYDYYPVYRPVYYLPPIVYYVQPSPSYYYPSYYSYGYGYNY
jgi:hypothetical protein